MPESRDRLSRAEDIPIVFTSRRSAVGGIAILVDESNVDRNLFGSPFRWGNTALTASNVPAATRGRFGTPRRGGNGRSRNLYGTPRATRENSAMGTGRRGRGRGRRVNTPLPHWYPRAPLRDVTTIVRVKIRSLFIYLFCWFILFLSTVILSFLFLQQILQVSWFGAWFDLYCMFSRCFYFCIVSSV